LEKDAEIVEICDTILFKGKSHMKRMSGISVLTKQLFTNWDYKLCTLKEKIRKLFVNLFSSNSNIELNLNKETDDEEFEIIVPCKKRKHKELIEINNI
jgi:hypothetical protein